MSGNETCDQFCFFNLNQDWPISPLDLSTTSSRSSFPFPPISTDNSWPLPLDLSVKTNYMINRQTSLDNLYENPEIITETKIRLALSKHKRSIKAAHSFAIW